MQAQACDRLERPTLVSMMCTCDRVVVNCQAKPWIDVIPESKINNPEYVLEVIENNKKVSKQHRQEIREYGIHEFGLENILAYEYLPKLQSLL